MKIWVDADATPKGVKEILFRVAEKRKVPVVFVANQWLRLPALECIRSIVVDQGADVADDKIHEECDEGDLVITADIPLADRVVKKGVVAIDPRGTVYDKSNIGQILGMRDFMDELRNNGVETGGPKSFNQKDIQKFANALDKMLAKQF